MKDKMKFIGVFGVFTGIGASRMIGKYFGIEGKVIVGFCALTTILAIILYLLIKKYYLGSLIMFLATLPLIVSVIGMYIRNDIMVGIGLALFIITLPVLIKVVNHIGKNR